GSWTSHGPVERVAEPGNFTSASEPTMLTAFLIVSCSSYLPAQTRTSVTGVSMAAWMLLNPGLLHLLKGALMGFSETQAVLADATAGITAIHAHAMITRVASLRAGL